MSSSSKKVLNYSINKRYAHRLFRLKVMISSCQHFYDNLSFIGHLSSSFLIGSWILSLPLFTLDNIVYHFCVGVQRHCSVFIMHIFLTGKDCQILPDQKDKQKHGLTDTIAKCQVLMTVVKSFCACLLIMILFVIVDEYMSMCNILATIPNYLIRVYR